MHGEAGLGAEDQAAMGWNGAGPRGLGRGRKWTHWEPCRKAVVLTVGIHTWEFALVIFRYLSGKRNKKRKADQPKLQQ